MKILSKISMFLVGAAALVSCNGPEKTIVDPANVRPAEIKSYPTENVVLDRNRPDESQITIKWNPAQYGYSAAITYTVLAVAEVDGGTKSAELGQNHSDTINLINKTLNGALVKTLNATPGEPFKFNLKLLCSIGASQYDTLSLPVELSVTPYAMDPIPMWLAGAYCGWHPDAPAETKAQKIYSTLANGVYSGWVSIIESGKPVDEMTPFKFTTHPNWSGPNYGGTMDALQTEGDPANLEIPNGYVNFFTLDVPKLKATIDKKFKKLAMVGNACPGDWGVDNELAYDFETNTFRAKLAMKSGNFKLRADGAWDIQWGKGAKEGELQLGGGDYGFSLTDGTYTVIVNISTPTPTINFIAE